MVDTGAAGDDMSPHVWSRCSSESRAISSETGGSQRTCTSILELQRRGGTRFVQVRVKFEETDVVYPVLSVAKPTEPGFKVEHVLRR